MGVTLCAGCALIALGPASAVFLVVVAPHADLVIRCILRCSRCCRCVLPAAALDGFLHVRLSVSQRLLLGVLHVHGIPHLVGDPRDPAIERHHIYGAYLRRWHHLRVVACTFVAC